MAVFLDDLLKWIDHLAFSESEMVIEAGMVLHKYQLDLYNHANNLNLLDMDCSADKRISGAQELREVFHALTPEVRRSMAIASYVNYVGVNNAFDDQQPLSYVTDGEWFHMDDIEQFHRLFLTICHGIEEMGKVKLNELTQDLLRDSVGQLKSFSTKEKNTGMMAMSIMVMVLVMTLINFLIAVFK